MFAVVSLFWVYHPTVERGWLKAFLGDCPRSVGSPPYRCPVLRPFVCRLLKQICFSNRNRIKQGSIVQMPHKICLQSFRKEIKVRFTRVKIMEYQMCQHSIDKYWLNICIYKNRNLQKLMYSVNCVKHSIIKQYSIIMKLAFSQKKTTATFNWLVISL